MKRLERLEDISLLSQIYPIASTRGHRLNHFSVLLNVLVSVSARVLANVSVSAETQNLGFGRSLISNLAIGNKEALRQSDANDHLNKLDISLQIS